MITYTQSTISIKVAKDGQVAEQEVEATVAEDVGLAYLIQPGEDPIMTLTHIRSGIRVGGQWHVTTEQEARNWIAALDEIIDWAGELPQIRPGMRRKVLCLAVIGALHEGSEEPSLESGEEL